MCLKYLDLCFNSFVRLGREKNVLDYFCFLLLISPQQWDRFLGSYKQAGVEEEEGVGRCQDGFLDVHVFMVFRIHLGLGSCQVFYIFQNPLDFDLFFLPVLQHIPFSPKMCIGVACKDEGFMILLVANMCSRVFIPSTSTYPCQSDRWFVSHTFGFFCFHKSERLGV